MVNIHPLFYRFLIIFRCEYILYRGLYRTAYARLSRGRITDTELQVGQFVIPRYGTTVQNDTKEARYLRSQKEALPEEHVGLSNQRSTVC